MGPWKRWVIGIALVSITAPCSAQGKRVRSKDNEVLDGNPDLGSLMEDPKSSAQGISTAAVNPYLGNQALLFNNQLQGLNGLNPGLLQNLYYGRAGIGGGIGAGGLLGLGGLNAGGIYPYSSAGAGLYQNPYAALALQQGAVGGLGTSGVTFSGAAAGINPLLLSGVRNVQYPVGVGNTGATNPYLTQSLLNPYSNYNQINPYNSYPFSSRFGIGAGRSRGYSSSNNEDE